MNSPKISILVPIYNVEKYLAQCLDSLLSQTLREIEIICINDGSTDGSKRLLEEYAKRDRRIFVIDKPNTGYGDSMNQGLKRAHGKYIGILEPDDWISPDGFAELYRLAQAHDFPEIVKANYFQEKGNKTKKISEIQPQDAQRVLNPAQYPRVFRLAPTIWTAIYRRDFLKKSEIDFLATPGASYQDTSFNFKAWASAKRVVLTTDAFVHYRLDNENSSVNHPDKANCLVTEYQEIETFLTERGLFNQFGSLMNTAKLRNYHWNLQRLSPTLAHKFYQTLRSELQSAAEEGVLNRDYFSHSEWRALNAILKHPRLAYRILRLRSWIRQ